MTFPAIPWSSRPGVAGAGVGGAGLATLGALVRNCRLAARRLVPPAVAVLTVLVAHVAIAPHLVVRGIGPDIVLVAVVAVAAGRGSQGGAVFGFAAGLGADLFLATPLGTTALAYTLVGHAVGAARPARATAATAAALCGPGSTCFSCRTGAGHRPAGGGAAPGSVRSGRARSRTVARRRAIRGWLLLTAWGVAAGRLAAAVVGTAVGGVPFPGLGGLGRAVAVGALSAPLGPPLVAAVRRLGGPTAPGGRD